MEIRSTQVIAPLIEQFRAENPGKPYPKGLMQEYYDAWRSEDPNTRMRVKDGGIYKAPERMGASRPGEFKLRRSDKPSQGTTSRGTRWTKAEYLEAGKSLGYTDAQVLSAYEREIMRQRSFMRHKSGKHHLDHIFPASRGGLEHSRNYRLLLAGDNLYKSAKTGANKLYEKMGVPRTLLDAVRMDLEDAPRMTGRNQRSIQRQAGLLRRTPTPPPSGYMSTQLSTTLGTGMIGGGLAPAVFDPAFPTDSPTTRATKSIYGAAQGAVLNFAAQALPKAAAVGMGIVSTAALLLSLEGSSKPVKRKPYGPGF